MQTVARIRMPEKGVFVFRVPASVVLMPGDACVVELDYGLDIGVVLELYGLNEEGGGSEKPPAFRVIRKRGGGDEGRVVENEELAEKARLAFVQSTSHEKGHVKILHTRFSYGRDRLFVRYSAQFPVDLRRFVGQLQRDFKTRVDLWQVGVRDEAALLGGLGPCGRGLCCCTWQGQFHPVNVRMAKTQEMSLNPVAINGTCGRLKCCLRFEYDQYCEASRGVPETGSVVLCSEGQQGEGVVVGRDVLRARLTVRMKDGRFVNVPAKSVTVLRAPQSQEGFKEGNHGNSDSEWPES